MIKHARLYVLCLIISTVTVIIKTDGQPSEIVHEVRKGETVSLICIDYYGHYVPAMGEAIKKLNPSLKNINTIYVGQKLTLTGIDNKQIADNNDPVLMPLERKADVTQGVVTYVEGSAYIIHDKSPDKKNLSENTIVGENDLIETGKNARVELLVNRETVVRLKPSSRCSLSSLRDNMNKKGSTSLIFSVGTVWVKVKKFHDKISRFQLELPTAVAGVHGTVYQTHVSLDTSSDVKVYNGEVEVKGIKTGKSGAQADGLTETSGPQEVAGPQEVSFEEWVRIVRSMQKIHIGRDGSASTAESFIKENDEWEKWNEERDARIDDIFEREIK